jgi:hypothetical protein
VPEQNLEPVNVSPPQRGVTAPPRQKCVSESYCASPQRGTATALLDDSPPLLDESPSLLDDTPPLDESPSLLDDEPPALDKGGGGGSSLPDEQENVNDMASARLD